MDPTLSQQEYRQQLLAIMRGYRQAQVLISCTEMGVFETLGRQSLTALELSERLQVHPGALKRLLNASSALGLVEKSSAGSYHVSPMAVECLAIESPIFIGNLVKREGAFYRRWSRLSQAVRTGLQPEENSRDEHDPDWVRNFELALYDAARTTAPAVALALTELMPDQEGPGPVRVIDIGGGHGAYSMALAERYPNLQAVIFELPAAAEVARELVASCIAERVSVMAGDFRVDPLGGAYDLALLFGVLVSETPDSARALLSKVHAALRPGGWLVIRGLYLNSARTGPLEANLSDLQMLLSTAAGGAHTLAEITAWLNESGFEPPQTIELPAPEKVSLLAARKPPA